MMECDPRRAATSAKPATRRGANAGEAILRMAVGRSPDDRVPRPRMGDPGPRRPQTVRVPDPGGRPGRALVAHGAPQTRGLPRGVRALRPGEGRALRRTRDAPAARRRRDHPQQAQDWVRDQERGRLPRGAGGVRDVRRLHLALRRREAQSESPEEPTRDPAPQPRVRRAQQGSQAARLHVRGLDHHVRPHAGRRARQRPHRRPSRRCAQRAQLHSPAPSEARLSSSTQRA